MTNDLTSGNVSKVIISFTIPMVLGNIFQQLYNTADSVIVGRFVGKDALAAVGVANPIMSLMIFFIYGICIGASVLLAQLYGAGNYKKFKLEVSTSLIAGVIFTVILTAVCMAFSRWMLVATKTPADILDSADSYLKIIFSGLIFSFLYNFYSAALRSIGDSRTPFIFLFIASILNVALDLIFVINFNMGVNGAAIATVIAQGVSSLLCIVYVYRKIPIIKLDKAELKLDKPLLWETVSYSWVSALQQTCLYFGKLLVQGVVNPFGTSAIAAYNAVTRVDSFTLAPGDSMCATMATYVAQNKGAGKMNRMKDGFIKSSQIIVAFDIACSVLVFVFARFIMGLFVSSTEVEVINIGIEYLRLMSVFYLLAGLCNTLQGLFRGAGKLKITLAATVIQMAIRVACSYLFAPIAGVNSVCYASLIGWTVMIIFDGILAKRYFDGIKQAQY